MALARAGVALLLDLVDVPPGATSRPPVHYLLASYLTPELVAAKAASEWSGSIRPEHAPPDEADFRGLWPDPDQYVRTVLILSLRRRRPDVADFPSAASVIDETLAGRDTLVQALERVALAHVLRLARDPAFRLQVVIEATPLGDDARVAEEINAVTSANVAVWLTFWEEITRRFGRRNWTGADTRRLAAFWYTGTEGVARAALHAYRVGASESSMSEPTRSILTLTVLGAFADFMRDS
jgi:hypothetical protein